MDYEWMLLLLLLLPLAYLSGWWTARRGFLNSAEGKHRGVPREYFKGLNYILNEQPDKAIEVFTKMLEVDSETVETHLALGNLFRRRGEVDRAIRIHQNLIARPMLSQDYRSLALLELGMDYMRSGLLDRAEGLFQELVDIDSYTVHAFRQLLLIYQQEKDWEKAVVIARRLEATSGDKLDPTIAHFYCELAEEQLLQDNLKQATDYLKRALNIDPKCVRASLVEARMAQQAGNFKGAIRAYKRVEKQDPEYLPEIISSLHHCYQEAGKINEFISYLREVHELHGGITALLSLTKMISETQGENEAVLFLSSRLRKNPTVRGVDRLIEYAIDKANGEIRGNLETIKELTGKLLQDRPVYRCNQCGFDAKHLHWQCPSCKNWNTIKPVHGVEGE